jgi:hypothetical protein
MVWTFAGFAIGFTPAPCCVGHINPTGRCEKAVNLAATGRCMLLAISGDVFEDHDYHRGRAKMGG